MLRKKDEKTIDLTDMNPVVKDLYHRPQRSLFSRAVRSIVDSLGHVPNRLPHDF